MMFYLYLIQLLPRIAFLRMQAISKPHLVFLDDQL